MQRKNTRILDVFKYFCNKTRAVKIPLWCCNELCGVAIEKKHSYSTVLNVITPAPKSRQFARKIHIHTALLKLAFHHGVLRFRALPECEFFCRSVFYSWAPE